MFSEFVVLFVLHWILQAEQWKYGGYTYWHQKKHTYAAYATVSICFCLFGDHPWECRSNSIGFTVGSRCIARWAAGDGGTFDGLGLRFCIYPSISYVEASRNLIMQLTLFTSRSGQGQLEQRCPCQQAGGVSLIAQWKGDQQSTGERSDDLWFRNTRNTSRTWW